MQALVQFRMDVLKSQNFLKFHCAMLMTLSKLSGEMLTNLYNKMTNEKKSYNNNPMFHENLTTVLEMVQCLFKINKSFAICFKMICTGKNIFNYAYVNQKFIISITLNLKLYKYSLWK